jgi:tripartite-type tricarboxylate transporter receptor subunit TctC/predicted amino acid-binding ACT domain protein
MTPAASSRWILTLSCTDRPGIVGAVGTFLATHACNIVESAQFGDRETLRFMMRVCFERLEGAPDADELSKAFDAIADRFGMQWELHDAQVPPRVLIMVSKFDHCLNDLLYRYRVGALAMEPVAIVSNHRDTYRLAAAHDVPFHHLPVTPQTKPAQEAKLAALIEETGAELIAPSTKGPSSSRRWRASTITWTRRRWLRWAATSSASRSPAPSSTTSRGACSSMAPGRSIPRLSKEDSMVLRIARLLAAAALLFTAAAGAQDYPARPVKIIVPFAAGGPADVYARVLAQRLQDDLGQPFVVEDRPGGGSVVGTDAVAKSAPDGYTLLLMSNTHTVNESLMPNKPFRLMRDFVAVAPINYSDLVLVVNPAVPVSTLPELIALAKKRPGELNIAAGNRGSILHFSAEWLRSASGIDATLVHYPGAPQALTDILGGRVHAIVDAASGLAGSINGGSIKALAVASEQRLPTHPGLPTVAETLPGFMAMGWFALMAPPKTPEATARKISDNGRSSNSASWIWELICARCRPRNSRASSPTSSGSGSR